VLPEPVRAFVAVSPIQRAPIAAAVAAEAAAIAPGSRVLDAGAGEAPYRLLFGHCAYVTQDWPGSVHETGRGSDILADLHDLPVEDASFDAVVCTEVLEHVAEPASVLAELSRVLRPGGRLLLTVPFVIELHEEPHDHYRYTSHGLRGLLERAGFTEIDVRPSTGWFATVAQTLRHSGNSMLVPDVRGKLVTRALTFGLLGVGSLLGRLAPALDRRLDARRAMPLGWIARARRPA
jgi:SAM-dependent methyltransferase